MSFNTLHFPATTLADRHHVSRCVNLRPDPASDGLTAVGRPVTRCKVEADADDVYVKDGFIILSDGTECSIMVHHGALKAVTPAGAVTLDSDDNGVPECLVRDGDSIIVMWSEGSPRRYTCKPDHNIAGGWSWQREPLFSSQPPLSITRCDTGTVNAVVAAVTLKSSYTANSQQLSDSDQVIVDKAMRESYLRLSDRALRHGRYIQPVVARYVVTGHNGETLYTSAPVVIAPALGMQAVKATLKLSGDGYRQVEASRISAVAFVPALEFTRQPDEVWNTLVRSVTLLVSPQLHPYSATLPGSTYRTGTSSTQLTMVTMLPGVNSSDDYTVSGSRMAARVAALIDNADSALMAGVRPADTLAEINRLESVTGATTAPAMPADELTVRLSAPHGFTAVAGAVSGNLVAWAGLTAIPFDGYTLPEMAVTSRSATGVSLPTAVMVKMRDGSSVVRTSVMIGRDSPELSPLLVYPSPDAVEMTLLAGDKGRTVSLVTTPCGRASYFLSPDLCPLSLDEERGGFTVPSASPPRYSYPSAIAVCRASSPLTPVAVSHGDGSAIHSVLPALRQSNSFTVPSARFYLFGSGGIYSMTLTDSSGRININMLDPRRVESAGAVTPIDGGVAAVASGSLVMVTGSRPHTLLRRCSARSLLWSAAFGELWCVDDDVGELTVVSADGKVRYTRTGIDVLSAVSTGHGARILTRSGEILDPSVERNVLTSVRHTSSVRHKCRPGAIAMLEVPLYGVEVEGSVALSVTQGVMPVRSPGHFDGNAPDDAVCMTLTRLNVADGNLNHGLREAVPVSHSHVVTLDIDITTSNPSQLKLYGHE